MRVQAIVVCHTSHTGTTMDDTQGIDFMSALLIDFDVLYLVGVIVFHYEYTSHTYLSTYYTVC